MGHLTGTAAHVTVGLAVFIAGAVVCAAISAVLDHEYRWWGHRFAAVLIRWIARGLPADRRGRFLQESLAEIESLRRDEGGHVLYAFGSLVVAPKTAFVEWRSHRRERRSSVGLTVFHAAMPANKTVFMSEELFDKVYERSEVPNPGSDTGRRMLFGFIGRTARVEFFADSGELREIIFLRHPSRKNTDPSNRILRQLLHEATITKRVVS